MNYIDFLRKELPVLLEGLHATAEPKWGMMSAQHMIEHLSGVILISNGRFEAPAMYDEEKLSKNYNYIILGQNRLKRNTKAPILPEEPLPLRFGSLAEAKEKLLKTIDSFFKFYAENQESKQMHPAFGLLNFEDWVYFHCIHIQYHLDQFGLCEGGARE
jgi:hydroxymethylglutaryl-CoA reductase